MLDDNKKKGSDNSILNDLNMVLHEVREELDDHLQAINENTNEVQANYELVCQLDAKLERLAERMDQMQLFMQRFGFTTESQPQYSCKQLSKKEQDVFLRLYTLEERGAVSYEDLSRHTGLPVELISSYIISMTEKGVPILRRHIHNKVYLKLDSQFKKIQAKENVLKISQTIIPGITGQIQPLETISH